MPSACRRRPFDLQPRGARQRRQPRHGVRAGAARLHRLGRADRHPARIIRAMGRRRESPPTTRPSTALLEASDCRTAARANVAGIVSGYLASRGAGARRRPRRRRGEGGAAGRALSLRPGDRRRRPRSMSARRSPPRSATRSCRSPTSRRRTPSNAPGWPVQTTASNPDLAALARRLAPPTVLVTSAPALMRGQIGNLLVTESETILFEHPRARDAGQRAPAISSPPSSSPAGSKGRDWPKAAELALSSVFEIVAGTAKAGADELMLAELQDFARPPARVDQCPADAERRQLLVPLGTHLTAFLRAFATRSAE